MKHLGNSGLRNACADRGEYINRPPIVGVDISACQATGHDYTLLDGPFFKKEDRLGTIDRKNRYWLFCCRKCGRVFEYCNSNEMERA